MSRADYALSAHEDGDLMNLLRCLLRILICASSGWSVHSDFRTISALTNGLTPP